MDLRLTARNAQPFASSIVSGTVNADLTLTGTALHELTLVGSVLVNKATVEIPNNFPPNVAVLDVRRSGQVDPGGLWPGVQHQRDRECAAPDPGTRSRT